MVTSPLVSRGARGAGVRVVLGRFVGVVAIGVAGWMAGSLAARADWPIRRHDAARTAHADRASELAVETPAIVWRYYLGGSVGVGNVVALDVDGDGLREMAFLS